MKAILFKVAALAASFLAAPVAAFAGTYNITVDYVDIEVDGHVKRWIGYNGKSPGPTLRFKEGEEVVINVTNNLVEDTSIHWHGLILPFEQDGVPGFSYPGFKPGETFTHRFPIVQSGTYWFHSHSGFQEPDGAYGALVGDDSAGVFAEAGDGFAGPEPAVDLGACDDAEIGGEFVVGVVAAQQVSVFLHEGHEDVFSDIFDVGGGGTSAMGAEKSTDDRCDEA